MARNPAAYQPSTSAPRGPLRKPPKGSCGLRPWRRAYLRNVDMSHRVQTGSIGGAWRVGGLDESGLAFPSMMSREIRLAARPTGEPQPSDFELAEVEVAEPAEGEIVVRNALMSVDPYMRGRMDDRESYVPPFVLGEPLS